MTYHFFYSPTVKRQREGKFVALKVPRSWLINLGKRSWRDAVREIFASADGPIHLSQLYNCLAHDPKAYENPNYRAKIRQTLKRAKYVNVGPGLWQEAA
jgi:hypothetical protein